MTAVINHSDILNFFYEVEDLKDMRNDALFGAIVIFDLSKRPLAHAKPLIKTYSITGDDLQDAIKRFRESDSSRDLKDFDFEPEVFKVALCFNF